MNALLIDIWSDLREKRLWPVAAVLLVCLVAVPVVLSKPSEEPDVPAPTATAPQAPTSKELKGLAALTAVSAEPGIGSALDVFDSSDPFRPPSDVAKQTQQNSGDGGAPSEAGGSSEDTAAGSGEGGGDAGTPGDSGTPPDDAGRSTTTEFRYVIDVTFTANGRTRAIKGLEPLDVLPSQASPLLIFMGVTSGGGNAVFLIDSTLEAAGEGSCKPSKADCAFVHLGAGSEHEFTNEDGDSYSLLVDQIRKVKIGDDTGAADDSGQTASAASGSATVRRHFVPPLIADLVSVSSETLEASDTGRDRR